MYDRHTPMLYRVARRVLDGDPDAAEDAVQEAWVRAIEGLGAFRGEGAFRTWLTGFVIRIAREQWRRPPRASDGDAPDASGPAPHDDPVRGAIARLDLERALAALAPGFRQVIWMHDVEGFTHDEIATLLGIVPGTSKSQLARARAALRRALHDGG